MPRAFRRYAASEACHDYFRWPAKDRKVFEGWKRETHWGRLVETYGREKVPGKIEGAGVA